MTVIVWTHIPILLDPILCHAQQDNLKIYLSYNEDQELYRTAVGDRILADLWKLAAFRPLTKDPTTSTLMQKVIRIDCRHGNLFCTLTSSVVILGGKSRGVVRLNVQAVGVVGV